MEKQILRLARTIWNAVDQWDRDETPILTREQICAAVSDLKIEFTSLCRKPTREEKKAFKELDFAVYNSKCLD